MDNILTRDGLTEIEEILFQTQRRTNFLRNNTGPAPERRSTISSMLPSSYPNTRMRNLSGGSSGSTASGSSSGSLNQLDSHFTDMQHHQQQTLPLEILLLSGSSPTISSRAGSSLQHRKLDRSWSDNDADRNGPHRPVNSSRYKTELCRPFEESGTCKYGDKCQFAHGYNELRNLVRHPKYKTELCRTFHTVGFCPYGPRCHFIHEDEPKSADLSPKLGRANSSSGSSSPSLSPSGSDTFSLFSQPENVTQMRPVNMDGSQLTALTVNNNFRSSNNYDLLALEKHFSSIHLHSNSCINDNNAVNVFSANSNHVQKLIGSEERDIFSEITMFNSEDAMLDNAPASLTSCAAQSLRLDNSSFTNKSQPTRWPSYCQDY